MLSTGILAYLLLYLETLAQVPVSGSGIFRVLGLVLLGYIPLQICLLYLYRGNVMGWYIILLGIVVTGYGLWS